MNPSSNQPEPKKRRLNKETSNENQLPILSHRDEILRSLRNNSTVIIVGETGMHPLVTFLKYLLNRNFTQVAAKALSFPNI